MPPAPLAVPSRVCATLVGLLSLAALVLQYVLILQLTRDNVGVVLGTVRFVTYFTILSNIAVMLVACAAAAGQPGFFAQARVRGAVALYIGVTGSIYFFILRHLWQPQGAQWWADTGLHYAVPLAYWAWWLTCVPHGTLRWRDVAGWLLFPLGYVVWVFLRGAWVGGRVPVSVHRRGPARLGTGRRQRPGCDGRVRGVGIGRGGPGSSTRSTQASPVGATSVATANHDRQCPLSGR